MKFTSKQSNYRVVLRHGMPAEPITGRAAVPGISIKFENGQANVQNEEYCKLLMDHPAFNRDFILAEEPGVADPWQDFRRDPEPEHDITAIEYGHVGKNANPKPKISLSRDKQRELKEIAKGMAVEMAKEMAPQMAKTLLETLAAQKQAEKKPSKSSDVKSEKEEAPKEENESEEKAPKTTTTKAK